MWSKFYVCVANGFLRGKNDIKHACFNKQSIGTIKLPLSVIEWSYDQIPITPSASNFGISQIKWTSSINIYIVEVGRLLGIEEHE